MFKKIIVYKQNDAIRTIYFNDPHLSFRRLTEDVFNTLGISSTDIVYCGGDLIEDYSETKQNPLLSRWLDAIVPGNHLFYKWNTTFNRTYAPDNSQKLSGGYVELPWVAANTYYRDSAVFEDYRIIERDGARFGVIGLANFPNSESALKNPFFEVLVDRTELYKKVSRLISFLRKIKHVDYIDLLTHFGIEDSRAWFNVLTSDGLLSKKELMVYAAHDHVVSPIQPLFNPAEAVIESGSHLQYMGTVLRQKSSGEVVIYNNPVAKAPENVFYLNFSYPFVEDGQEYQDFYHTSPMAGRMGDLMRKLSGSDLVVLNAGMFRWGIPWHYKNIFADIDELVKAISPFKEGLVELRLTIEEVKSLVMAENLLIEQNILKGNHMFSSKTFLHTSGLRYESHMFTTNNNEGGFNVAHQLKDVQVDVVGQDKYRVLVAGALLDLLKNSSGVPIGTLFADKVCLDRSVIDENYLTYILSIKPEELLQSLTQGGIIDTNGRVLLNVVSLYESADLFFQEMNLDWLDLKDKDSIWKMLVYPIYMRTRDLVRTILLDNEPELMAPFTAAEFQSRKRHTYSDEIISKHVVKD